MATFTAPFDGNSWDVNDPDGPHSTSRATADGNDTVFGPAGNEILQGYGGIDVLYGNDGDDTLYGDTKSVANISADDGGDYLYGGGGNDYLDGGNGDDHLEGQSGRDRLYGGKGNDQLFGGTGADSLFGAAGDDLLDGGAGADYLDGGIGVDTATFSNATGPLIVDMLSVSPFAVITVDGGTERDSLISIENILGTAFNDEITGSNVANVLDAGLGDDTVTGAGGDDTITAEHVVYFGDRANYTIEALGGGRYRVTDNRSAAQIEADTPGGVSDGTDLLNHVLSFEFQDGVYTTVDLGLDDFADELGLPGAGVLEVGVARTGTIEVAFDDDWFVADLEAGVEYVVTVEYLPQGGGTLLYALLDVYGPGGYVDTIDFVNGRNEVDVVSTFTAESSGMHHFGVGADFDETGTYTISVVEANPALPLIEGTAFADRLRGTADPERIEGLGGNDTLKAFKGADEVFGGRGSDIIEGGKGGDLLVGNGGRDTMYGGSGADVLKGGSGADVVKGGSGNDTVKGGGAKDVLAGGAGDDSLTGGKDADTFQFRTGWGTDTITDFDAKGRVHDTLDLSRLETVRSWNDLVRNHLEVDGADVVIDGRNGDVIVLRNVDLADLEKGHFDF